MAWPVNKAAAAAASPSSSAAAGGYSVALADLVPGVLQMHAHAAHAGAFDQETGQLVAIGWRGCVEEVIVVLVLRARGIGG